MIRLLNPLDRTRATVDQCNAATCGDWNALRWSPCGALLACESRNPHWPLWCIANPATGELVLDSDKIWVNWSWASMEPPRTTKKILICIAADAYTGCPGILIELVLVDGAWQLTHRN